MGITLTSKTINSTYDSLLKLSDNDSLTGAFKVITDGLGNDTGVSLNNTGDVTISGTLTVNTRINTPLLQLTGGTGTQGELSWNADEETLDLVNNGAVLQLGQEIHIHVRNNSVTTAIPNGTPVYVAGTLGASGRLKVAPMIADGSIAPEYFIGVTTEDIEADGDGKVTFLGKVRGFNTSGYTEGSKLYVSETVAGGWQTTEPTAPHPKLEVAFTVNQKSNGTIFVRSQNGHYLTDTHDINITSVADKDLLVYDSTNGIWKNSKTLGNITTGTISSGNITTSGYLRGPATFVIDPSAYDDVTGLVQILGDLRVDGVTTTVNSTTVTINDKNIVLADEAVTAADANGAGITINGANATLAYASATDDFHFNKNVNASTFIGALTGNVTGNADTASKWATARTITLGGDLTGNVLIDGSANVTLTAAVVDDSHTHDGRYYTETEADGKFLLNTTDTLTGDLTVTGEANIKNTIYSEFGSSNTDITGLLSGSTFGTWIKGRQSGHVVIGLRDNDANDSFAIMSGSGNYTTDTTYDKLLARFEANGNITLGGNTSINGTLSATGGNITGDTNITTKLAIGKTTAPAVELDVSGAILALGNITTTSGNVYALGGNSTEWNSAYDYSQVGHLPLSGGTLSGGLTLDYAAPTIILYDPNTSTGNYPQVRFNTANNQGVKLVHNEFDGELPASGYGLVLTGDDSNSQFPTTGTLSFVVHGEIFTGGTTNGTVNKVLHAGNYTTYTDNKYLRSDTSDTMNGSLTVTGNVGIGTTSPTKKLDVNGDSYLRGELITASGYVRMNTYLGGLNAQGEIALWSQGGTGWNVGDSLGRIRFYSEDGSGIGARDVAKIEALSDSGNDTTSTTMSGALAFYTSAYNANIVEAMRIDSSGNVGIGTSSPDSKLDVRGGSASAADGNQILSITNTTGGSQLNLGVLENSYGWIEAREGATLRSLLLNPSGGNVGIGTTSPSAKLDVAGSIKGTGLLIDGGAYFDTNTGTQPVYITRLGGGSESLQIFVDDANVWFESIQDENTGTYGGYVFTMDGGGVSPSFDIRHGTTTRFRFEADGDFHADGDIIAYSTTISDRRLKDEIETIPNALDKVKSMRGVSYVWNNGSRKGQKDLGLIAQEVEEVLPEIVREKEMALVDGETYKTVDYEKIVGVLINAVKELNEKVESLEKQLKSK